MAFGVGCEECGHLRHWQSHWQSRWYVHWRLGRRLRCKRNTCWQVQVVEKVVRGISIVNSEISVALVVS